MQSNIGKWIFLTGAVLVGISVFGIFISVISPVFSLLGFLGAALLSLSSGFTIAEIEAMNFTRILALTKIQLVTGLGSLISYVGGLLGYDAAAIQSTFATNGLAISIWSYLTGVDAAIIKESGFLAALYTRVTGQGLATAATMTEAEVMAASSPAFLAWSASQDVAAASTATFTGTIWAMAESLWANPLTGPILIAVGAITALVAGIYYLGEAWGWWSDLWTMGQAVWSGMVYGFQQLYIALTPIGQIIYGYLLPAWNALVSLGQQIYSALLPAYQAIVNFFNLFNAANAQTALITIWNALVGAAQQLYTALIPVGSAITWLWNMFWNSPLPEIVTFVLMQLAPITDLIAIVYELGKAWGWWKDIGGALNQVWGAVIWTAQGLWSILVTIGNLLYSGFMAAWNGVIVIWNALVVIGQGLWNVLTQIGNVSSGGISTAWNSLVSVLRRAWCPLEHEYSGFLR
jgi:hypothetical protein